MFLGIFLAFLNSILLGLVGVVDKIGISHTGNPLAFSIQSISVSILVSLIIAITYLNKSFLNQIQKTTTKGWIYAFLVGMCSSGLFVIFRFFGLLQSTGTFATLSQVITSSLTAFLAWIFLKERLSKSFWVLFIIIVFMTYFVSVGELVFTTIKSGDFFILIATVFLASGNIFSKLALKNTHVLILSFIRFIFGEILLLIVGILFFSQNIFFHFSYSIWAVISGVLWAITIIIFNFAIIRIGVTFTTSIVMMAPIYTLLIELLFLKYQFTSIQIAGIFVIMTSGILMVVINNRNFKKLS